MESIVKGECSEMSFPKKPGFSDSWSLLSLAPKYIEVEHGKYVNAIQAALDDEQILNIALSGNYGVGKSSILREVAQRQGARVVELSLSTLAPIEASKLDESVPIQATTPTNRIQQEIVKQLLYREDPRKTPGSRFRRIERFRWLREVGVAVLVGFIMAIIYLLTGWTAQIATVFSVSSSLAVWGHLVTWFVAAGAVLLVRWMFYGQLHIKQFSAGSATVTLDDNSVSYFDQYLDEIVYFFDISGRDIVIFEDIDRFNDSHIFETLRALNTLLNASPQIKRPIRFIYAIKDSIFDRIGLEIEGRKLEAELLAIDDPAQAEAIRANRTKFFDLVIPVVPFITHRSARSLAVQLLGQIEHKVAPELLDLAGQYVPDMRLLKNVRNEFIIFRDRIFSGDGEWLNLSETDLFAIMLYKSTHLTDFETIRLGTSKLDVLYKISRQLVTENINQIEDDRRELRQRLTRIDGAATRCARLGERLIAHVRRTAEAVNYPQQNATFVFNEVVRSVDDLKQVSFWKDFVEAEASDAVLRWNITLNYSRVSLSFTRKNLVEALGDPLDLDRWREKDRKALSEQIDEKAEDISFLRSADLSDLVQRPDFLVDYQGRKQSFETIAKMLLKPGLAFNLIRAGYINRNFTLYTSTFHGDRVGPAATNFIIHHVERDLMDEHFDLTAEDVDAIVRERGRGSLKESALYNITILDHLLMTETSAADVMIRSLASLGESQTRFLKAYLAAGKHRSHFIERFTIFSSSVLVYLVSKVSLEDTLRLQLIDVALAYLPISKQRIDLSVSEYLSMHYSELNVLTSDATKQEQAERIGSLFLDATITVSNLKPLGLKVRSSLVARSLYMITHENLTIAIDNTATVALDVIRAANETVYRYVLDNLSVYLDAIHAMSATLDANEQFITVIEDVLGQRTPCIDDVIGLANPDCKVTDLTDIHEGAWPALAKHIRFPATFGNVNAYLTTHGSVDASLAKTLAAAGRIIEVNSVDEDSKATMALAILAVADHLLAAETRVQLVESLKLENYLDVGDITAELGKLFALLLKYNIIADDTASYERLAATDWSTRMAFICESRKFAKYMTAELITSDLATLLKSDEISLEIKFVIIENASVYAAIANQKGLSEIARFAIFHGKEISLDVLHNMAKSGVASHYVVLLLKCHLASMSRDQLSSILLMLGEDYPKLAKVGYEKPRIPNTPADRALLERLKRDGIVGKYDENASPIKVNKRYK